MVQKEKLSGDVSQCLSSRLRRLDLGIQYHRPPVVSYITKPSTFFAPCVVVLER